MNSMPPGWNGRKFVPRAMNSGYRSVDGADGSPLYCRGGTIQPQYIGSCSGSSNEKVKEPYLLPCDGEELYCSMLHSIVVCVRRNRRSLVPVPGRWQEISVYWCCSAFPGKVPTGSFTGNLPRCTVL